MKHFGSALFPLFALLGGLGAAAWAAVQSPAVAAAFHVACLAVWVGHGAWRRLVARRPASPLPFLLATLAPLVLTVSLGRLLFPAAHGFWQSAAAVAACVFTTVLAYMLNGLIARLPFLQEEEKSPNGPIEGVDEPVQDWIVLPNGLKFRSLCVGEIGMGGPLVYKHVFSNGIELGGGDLVLSADGRYAACADPRDHSDLVLADLENGILRDALDDAERRAIAKAGDKLARVSRLLQDAKAVQFVRVRGLWVSPQADIPPDSLVLSDRQGRARLCLERLFDSEELQAAEEPLRYLLDADYAVTIDGEAQPISTRAPDRIVWNEAGDMLLIPRGLGHQPSAPGSHWLWRQGGESGWVSPGSWKSDASLPSGGVGNVTAIDRDGYWLDLYMNRPSPSAYPHRIAVLAFPSSYTCGGPYDWIVGADERGRMVIRDVEAKEGKLRVRLPWPFAGRSERDGVVESAPGADPARVARFVPCPGAGDSGRLRYRVEVGPAHADGVELYHLWSDCGRYLALQPHLDAGEAADRFFVLDTVSGQRLETAFRGRGLQLAAWVAGELQVGVVVGSVRGIDSFDPFGPIAPPPPPDKDGYFRHEWLRAECLRFRVDPAGPALSGPLPKHVELTLPPYPNAAFDFYYHAPGRLRSIFVFGARNEYQDDYARAESCRYAARAVTSDGICLAELGVGMIWSADARYLVVTTRVPVSRGHPDYVDLVWKARLVDCEQRLIYPATDLGGMPIFERFSDGRVDYRRVDADWWREDVDTLPAHLDMAALMQGPPAPLAQHEGLWLAKDGDWNPRWLEIHAQAFGQADGPHNTR